LQRIVVAAARNTLMANEIFLLASAAALLMVAMTTIGAALVRDRHNAHRSIGPHVAIAALTAAAGSIRAFAEPVASVVLLASSCAVQLAVSLGVMDRVKSLWTSPSEGVARV